MTYLTHQYDLSLVIASVLIASFASYVALDLAKRVSGASGPAVLAWWVGGSIAMGTGIWSMHFVGMLAFSLPIALGFTRLLTFVSWVAAVAVSLVGLGLAARGTLTAGRLAIGSLAMGTGICAMHYLGMAALDMSPPIEWSAVTVAASAAIAIAASAVALVIFFWLKRVGRRKEAMFQVSAAVVMGLAISGMHYTGMAAANFPSDSVCLSATLLSRGTLSLWVGAAAVTVLGLTLLTSIIEGRMQEARLSASLREANAELLSTAESLKAEIAERQQAEQKLQSQLERLMLLDQISRAIGERQDLQSIQQVVVGSLESRLPVDFACICRHEADETTLTIVSVGTRGDALALAVGLEEHARISIDQNGLSRALQGELVYEPDVREIAFPFPSRLAAGGLRALVIAPLQTERRVFGLLVAARMEPGAFSSGDCEFLRQLSAHVALAAGQAELHSALQQAYDDLRQSQQAVMQQERLRALGQMASGIAHDINNALSPAALYAESLLEREAALSGRGRDHLETIARAIDDVSATVARMREFYREREPQLELMAVDLNPLVRQVLELTRARWSDMPMQRGTVVKLETELAPDLPIILGVESEVREALINLIFNAVDAMPEGGVMTLRTRHGTQADSGGVAPAVEGVIVEVTDTGVGMDEDTRRRCLEPFFTTKGDRGTGLGLAMVYGIAQRHGAEIDIESVVGRGTSVCMRFPAPTDRLAMQDAPREADVPSRPLRVLVIDDDALMLRSLRETLELDGHVVVTASDGRAGIDMFLQYHGQGGAFDIVITDLGMPYVDGRQVAAAIKARDAAVPVILLTGWGQRLKADGEIPPYVNEVLSKPPKLREVRMALARWTATSRPAGG